MPNEALRVNGNSMQGQVADIALTVEGSNWLWAVCAVFTLMALVTFGLSFTRPRTSRLFHYITGTIFLVAAISYFTLASNLGWTPIAVQYVRSNRLVRGTYRAVFYVRYIDWFITTPLLLLDLLLTAALPWPVIFFTILLDEVMIVTGLVGALVRSSYKWGFFAFGCAAMIAVAYTVLVTGRMHARPLGSDVNRLYLTATGILALTWVLYPIAWGLSEGGNVISPDSEAIFYGILDLISKVVFGVVLLLGHARIEPARLGLHIRDYDDAPRHPHLGAAAGGEKHPHAHNGVTDPTAPTATSAVPASTTQV